ASMVRTFPTTMSALADVDWSISAMANWRALTVRFSIWEEEADSVRSRIEDIGPKVGESTPRVAWVYESNRARVAAASSTSAANPAGMRMSSRTISGGMADR